MTETPFGVVIGRQAQAAPRFPALTCGDVTISRAELEARTNRLARAYRALGVKPDSLVTIGLPNGIGFFEAAIAAWKLGATPQPISSRLPAAERRAIVDLAEPVARRGRGSRRGARPADAPRGLRAGRRRCPPIRSRRAVAASFKAPTSGGSTGRPKLIVATQPAIWEALGRYTTLLRMTPDGVHLVTGPLYHNGPFTSGALAPAAGQPPRGDAALRRRGRARADRAPSRRLDVRGADDDAPHLATARERAHAVRPLVACGWCSTWPRRARRGSRRRGSAGSAASASSSCTAAPRPRPSRSSPGDEWLEHRGSVGRVRPRRDARPRRRTARSCPPARSARSGCGAARTRRRPTATSGPSAKSRPAELGVARRHGLDGRPRATST